MARRVVEQAKRDEGGDFKISARGLQRWDRQYHAINPDAGSPYRVDGLIDRYGASPDGRRSPEAVDLFYTLYHTEQRHSLRHCHEVARRAAKRNGWQWAASESATRAWSESCLSWDARCVTPCPTPGGPSISNAGSDHDGSRRRVICKVPRNKAVSPTASSTAQDMRDAQAERNRADKMRRRAAASSATRTKTAAQIMEDDRHRRHRELLATGTHGKPDGHPNQTLRVIQTGIDAASIDARAPTEPLPPPLNVSLADLLEDDAPRDTLDDADAYDFTLGDVLDDDPPRDEGDGNDAYDFALGDILGGDPDETDAHGGLSIEDLL